MKRIDETFPDKEFIKDVYEHLAYFFQVAVGSGMGEKRKKSPPEMNEPAGNVTIKERASQPLM